MPKPPPSDPYLRDAAIRFDSMTGLSLDRIGMIYHFENQTYKAADGGSDTPVRAILPLLDILDLKAYHWLARAASIQVPHRERRLLAISIRWITPKYMILSSGDVLEYTVEKGS